jgi:membrane associated rhomboid family serine protease
VPVTTIALIAINALVFAYELSLSIHGQQDLFAQYGVVPARLTDGSITGADAVRLITSMFLHGDVLHIGGNMLYLWIFGNNIEDRLGVVRFILFYFLAGFAASFAQILMNPTSELPMIGASGAIAGILGAYIILYPRARVQTLIFFGFWIQVVNISAIILLGWWFLLQILNAFLALGAYAQGGVAFFAHIGGFIVGIILISILTLGRRQTEWWTPPPERPPRTDRWWD